MNVSRTGWGLDRYSGLYLWAIFSAAFGLLVPDEFLSMTTVHVVASSQAVAGIMAIALLIPLVCGNFDLSVGANANLTGLFAVVLQVSHGWAVLPAVLASVLLGGLIGLLNGFVVVKLRVSSFIATLGMSSILSAALIILTDGIVPAPPTSAGWSKMTQFTVGGFQIVIVYLVVVSLIAWWVLDLTPAGRNLRATGGNAESARLSGVLVDRWSWASLVASGAIAGLGGVLYTSLTGPSFTFGPSLLLPAFAAVFLGSTQLQPGRPNVWGTLIAIFVLATGVQGLALMSGVQWLSQMFNGVALILAVALATARSRPGRRALPTSRKNEGPPADATGPEVDPARVPTG